MRRLVVLAIALIAAPTAHAASLDVQPRAFSPAIEPLSVTGEVEAGRQVGVQLATPRGEVLGWLVEPGRAREVSYSWNGTLGGQVVEDGRYRAQLVVDGKVVAASAFRLDATAPALERLRVSSGSEPFAGDTPLLTTISPNGDGFRDRARVRFTLSEPAKVTLEVQRTRQVPQTFLSTTQELVGGEQELVWAPPQTTPARTYVLALTATDSAGNRITYGAPDAFVGRYPRAPVVRVQGVDAGFTRPSYAPGQLALLRISTDAPSLKLQVFQTGPEQIITYADNLLEGIPVTEPWTLGWERRRDATQAVRFRVESWPSGLYFVKLTAPDGRFGYAPFVVRPARFGALSRVAVVLPTNSWQAYNFWDANGDGWGDTWYAGRALGVALDRPYTRRGVPPFFYRYDQGFLHWLHWSGKSADFLAESDLAFVRTGAELATAYDLVVFPGHTEYVTEHEYELIREYRDAGGNLMFLSANNFFWRVDQRDWKLHKVALWRDVGKPEAALLGIQYLANDGGQKQGLFTVRNAAQAPWVWDGTGLADGSTFGEAVGGYGIEIDRTTPDSPPGTLVLAELPNVFGEGVTGEMTYYETEAGAKVFAAGALDFGGSALTSPVRSILENMWARLTQP